MNCENNNNNDNPLEFYSGPKLKLSKQPLLPQLKFNRQNSFFDIYFSRSACFEVFSFQHKSKFRLFRLDPSHRNLNCTLRVDGWVFCVRRMWIQKKKKLITPTWPSHFWEGEKRILKVIPAIIITNKILNNKHTQRTFIKIKRAHLG